MTIVSGLKEMDPRFEYLMLTIGARGTYSAIKVMMDTMAATPTNTYKAFIASFFLFINCCFYSFV